MMSMQLLYNYKTIILAVLMITFFLKECPDFAGKTGFWLENRGPPVVISGSVKLKQH